MVPNKNVYLQQNAKRISVLFHELEEERLKSYPQGSLNIALVISVLKGCINEIGVLANENEKLKGEMRI